jgi:hypothetical protein
MTRLQHFLPFALMAFLMACAGGNPLSYDGQVAQPEGRVAI